MIRKLAVGLISVTIVLLGLAASLKFILSEHEKFRKNSISYYLLIDSEIKAVPVILNQTDALFTYRPADGTAPEIQSVSIAVAVNEDISDMKSKIEEFLLNKSFVKEHNVIKKANTVIEIDLPNESNRLVVKMYSYI